jgi:hypothetical protein
MKAIGIMKITVITTITATTTITTIITRPIDSDSINGQQRQARLLLGL